MNEEPGRQSSAGDINVRDPLVQECIDRYWKANVRIMGILLAIWAIAGLGCGVLLADVLNRFSLGGIPLGFWFAQQGSILVFVVLVFVYALLLNRLDTRHHRELDALRRKPGGVRRAGEASATETSGVETPASEEGSESSDGR